MAAFSHEMPTIFTIRKVKLLSILFLCLVLYEVERESDSFVIEPDLNRRGPASVGCGHRHSVYLYICTGGSSHVCTGYRNTAIESCPALFRDGTGKQWSDERGRKEETDKHVTGLANLQQGQERQHDCIDSYSSRNNNRYLCGLVVRVIGYRSGGPGSIPGTTKKKK
jgi:hypothetical protein